MISLGSHYVDPDDAPTDSELAADEAADRRDEERYGPRPPLDPNSEWGAALERAYARASQHPRP